MAREFYEHRPNKLPLFKTGTQKIIKESVMQIEQPKLMVSFAPKIAHVTKDYQALKPEIC